LEPRVAEDIGDAFRRGLRFYVGSPGEPRFRRATDIVILVPALLGLALAIAGYGPSSVERALVRLFGDFPGWLTVFWAFAYDLFLLWAIALVVVALVQRRALIAGQAVAAVVLAVAIGALSARLATGGWPALSNLFFRYADRPSFPSLRLGASAAVAVTASAHLIRPLQRVGHWLLALGAVGAAVAGGATPRGVVAALLAALVAAACVRLVMGTSAGRPSLQDVAAALAELGVPAHSLAIDPRQVAGVLRVNARDDLDRTLTIEVYGRDAYDNQLLARIWRRLAYRAPGPAIGFNRLQLAQQEVFLTLLAQNAGVPSLEVVTAGRTRYDDTLAVLRGDATPFTDLPAGAVDEELVEAAWEALFKLEQANIAHSHIEPETLVLIGGRPGFVGYAVAVLSPDVETRMTDRAQLLVTTLAGEACAVAVVDRALGRDELAALLPYLQSAALSGSLRDAVRRSALDVDHLRESAATTVGVESPEPYQLRRVTWWALAQVGLLIFATWAVLSFASGFDWGEIWDAVKAASWPTLVLGFVIAQTPRVPQSFATLGSVPAALPLGPVYAMQLATDYLNLALPSHAGRMAVSIRFFQRQGMSATTAVASGVVDSVARTVVQAVMLLLVLLFSEADVGLDLPMPSGGARTLLFVLIGLVVAVVLVVGLVRAIRRRVIDAFRRYWPDVRATLVSLRSAHKIGLLVTGNVVTEILFALALSVFVRAFGYHVPLIELLVINLTVSLLGSFVPVPGNIGVAEFAVTVGLTSAGMPPETALATALVYRISTFYLPPVWGFGAMHWLQRNRYL
jgi:glycosyltransferase 2 family protein